MLLLDRILDMIATNLFRLVDPLINLFQVLRQLDVGVVSDLLRPCAAGLVIVLVHLEVLPLPHPPQDLHHQVAHHHLGIALFLHVDLDTHEFKESDKGLQIEAGYVFVVGLPHDLDDHVLVALDVLLLAEPHQVHLQQLLVLPVEVVFLGVLHVAVLVEHFLQEWSVLLHHQPDRLLVSLFLLR